MKKMETFHLHPPLIFPENMMEREKSVKHYSSNHQILLVGEGDFSFALSLASAFGSAVNILATSFDSYDKLINTYKKASFNLARLGAWGATLIHDVDARKMKDHPLLYLRRFDIIVYNFPHAGFYGKEDDPDMIKMHQKLVHGFFNNARSLLQVNGQIHVTHKTKHPYSCWNLNELAEKNSLVLMECVPFNIKDYAGYENKRGHGSTSDEPFDWKDSCTFKFTHSSNSNTLKFTHSLHSNTLKFTHSFHSNTFKFTNSLYSNIHSFIGEALPRVKFIVKGKVLHPWGAGYAGALVDEKHSKIRAVLCGPLPYSIKDADVAELLAVKYALLMFERSDICGRKVELVIESDSNQAVSWIKSEFGKPGGLLADLHEINMALGRIQNYVEFCCGRNTTISDGEHEGKCYDLVNELAVEGMRANQINRLL